MQSAGVERVVRVSESWPRRDPRLEVQAVRG